MAIVDVEGETPGRIAHTGEAIIVCLTPLVDTRL
jgi:hypothetical protein